MLGGFKKRGLVVSELVINREVFGFVGKPGDLQPALYFLPRHVHVAGGFGYAAFWTPLAFTATAREFLSKLDRNSFPILRRAKFKPMLDMLGALNSGQFGAVKVLRDFPHKGFALP